jgi:hypothetical protein
MIDGATMKKIIDEQDYELLAKEFTAVKHLIDALRAEKYPGISRRDGKGHFAGASVEEISRATGRNFNIAFTFT